MPRILKVYSENCFVFGDRFTRMVFPLQTTVKILELIKNNSKITREELAREIGISIDGIDYNIRKLKKEGKLRRIGPDKGGYWEILE